MSWTCHATLFVDETYKLLIKFTCSQVSTTVSFNEIVPGAKTAFSFKIPDQKSGKVRNNKISENQGN